MTSPLQEPFQSPLSPGVDTAPPSPPEAARQAAALGKKPGEDEPAWRKHIPYATKIGAALLFHAYLAAGIALTWHKAPDFCSDVKFLTVLTGIVYFFILWRPSIWALVWGAILTFLIVDSLGDSHRLISLSGIGLLVFLGFAFSNNRLKINWNQVLWGLLLQYLLGLMVLRWGHGRGALQCLSDKIKFFLDYTNQGSHFVFGHLASGFNLTDALGDLVTLVPKPELGANITNGTSHDIKNILPVSCSCEERNVLEAASNGATVGMVIIGHIVSNLVGFLAFLAFLNTMVGWFGAIVALDFLSFEWLLGQIFTPLAFAMGVPWDDCGVVGELIGIKTFANEFIAYSRLSELAKNIQPRSVVIATYALCGFSNFGSIGIMLGAMGAMAPARKGDLAEVSLRALAAGSAACFMTACVAGTRFSFHTGVKDYSD
ncbi:hypothetical protein HPB48_019665 [Haemaphysalis longicornis]|uniref:Sodium/nucleoside cotransporter n=1 Tax=Haemaphysalis longicornis TaxID=44386 RepID=A0A9J6G385_HAELO|nr:hypothetical protein HPB48_019665 [Haemaphysalis longicornis]